MPRTPKDKDWIDERTNKGVGNLGPSIGSRETDRTVCVFHAMCHDKVEHIEGDVEKLKEARLPPWAKKAITSVALFVVASCVGWGAYVTTSLLTQSVKVEHIGTLQSVVVANVEKLMTHLYVPKATDDEIKKVEKELKEKEENKTKP